MHHNLTSLQLTSAIEAFAVQYELLSSSDRDDFMRGQCDSFALGLQDALASIGVSSTLTRICRTTTFYLEAEEDGVDGSLDEVDYEETNDLCHVYLECLGTEWDIGGEDACERYEQHWFDEPNSETVFDYQSTNEHELFRIRDAKGEVFDEKARQLVAGSLRIILMDLVGAAYSETLPQPG